MARTQAQRDARTARDRAKYGVSSGTYYTMRRKARDRGIAPKDFDKVARSIDYDSAKVVTRIAKSDPGVAQDITGIIKGEKKLPGEKSSDVRKRAMAKLGGIWRKAGGKVTKLLGAIGSPPKRAKSAGSLR